MTHPTIGIIYNSFTKYTGWPWLPSRHLPQRKKTDSEMLKTVFLPVAVIFTAKCAKTNGTV